MKPQLGYLPVESVYPHQGLNTQIPSTLLNPHFSPDLLNVSVLDGLITKRKGYHAIGGTGPDDGNTIMALGNFQTVTGVNYLICITTAKQYYYDDDADAWVNITMQATGVDVDLTGSEINLVSYVAVTGTDTGKIFIFTNGVDKPRYWDGDPTHKFAEVLFNYPNFTTCKALATQNDRLIMGAITDTVYAPQNVAWSDAGKVNEWLSGTAGVQSLFNTDGEIWSLTPLADQLAVYAENSIHLMSYVGADAIYVFQKVLSDTRLVSSHAIVNLGPFHVFMGQDNFQLFDGSRTTIPVADAIHVTYRDELYTSKRHRASAFLDRAKKRAYFTVPVNEERIKHYVLEYDLNSILNSRWAVDVYNDATITMGFYISNTSVKWNSVSEAGKTWAEDADVWSSASGSVGFPARVLGSLNGGTFIANGTDSNDAGAAINSQWTSMDFTIPQEYQSEFARFQQIELEMMGASVAVNYATDLGATGPPGTIVPLTASWKTYRLPIDVVGRTLRIVVSNFVSNSSFSLRWLRLWLTPSGPY